MLRRERTRTLLGPGWWVLALAPLLKEGSKTRIGLCRSYIGNKASSPHI